MARLRANASFHNSPSLGRGFLPKTRKSEAYTESSYNTFFKYSYGLTKKQWAASSRKREGRNAF